MKHYLYIVDETGAEIPGSRRAVDFQSDRDGYFRVKAELERAAGEGCTVRDNDLDRGSTAKNLLIGFGLAALFAWQAIGSLI